MILAFVIAFAHALELPKRDPNVATKWEQQEIDQSKLMFEHGLPSPVCADDDWAVGLRRIIYGIKLAFPDKEFEVSNMTIKPNADGKMGSSATLCALVSMRAAPAKDESKESNKENDKPADKSPESPR